LLAGNQRTAGREGGRWGGRGPAEGDRGGRQSPRDPRDRGRGIRAASPDATSAPVRRAEFGHQRSPVCLWRAGPTERHAIQYSIAASRPASESTERWCWIIAHRGGGEKQV